MIWVTARLTCVSGVWSLWEISLSAEGLNRKRYLPVFTNEDGRRLCADGQTRGFAADRNSGRTRGQRHRRCGEVVWRSADGGKTQGERIFTELLDAHRPDLQEERERADYAFEARQQAIGRIGLPAVREHRRKRLQQEHDARLAALAEAAASVPDLNAVMMVRLRRGSTR